MAMTWNSLRKVKPARVDADDAEANSRRTSMEHDALLTRNAKLLANMPRGNGSIALTTRSRKSSSCSEKTFQAENGATITVRCKQECQETISCVRDGEAAQLEKNLAKL